MESEIVAEIWLWQIFFDLLQFFLLHIFNLAENSKITLADCNSFCPLRVRQQKRLQILWQQSLKSSIFHIKIGN